MNPSSSNSSVNNTSSNTSNHLIAIFTDITACCNLLLIVIGLIMNPLVFLVCVKSKKLKNHTTFKLLAVASINDLLSCILWNMEAFSVSFFNVNPPFVNLTYCRIGSTFIEFSTMQITSWMLVSISFDRFMSIVVIKWNNFYFTGKRPIIYSVCLIVAILALNFNEVLYGGYSYMQNGTQVIVCYETSPDDYQWMNIMSNVNHRIYTKVLSI